MSDESPEDQALDAKYRRLAALSAGAPAEATRRAILAQARALAATRAPRTLRTRAALLWARPALFGALAAGVVAGLVVAPRWRPPVTSPAPLEVRIAPAATPAQSTPSGALTPEAPRIAAAPPAAPPLDRLRLQEPAATAVPAPRAASSAAYAPSQPATAISNTTTAHIAAPELPGAQLRHAAEVGDLAQLEALSRGQPDLNARDARGRTALMLATVNGHANVVAALLAYGADPRQADAQGVTPLAAARAAGDAEIVAIFARYGLR